MRRAALVDEHPDARVPAHDRAGGARVVEMNVREEHVRHVGEAQSLRLQAELERLQATRGTGVDERERAAAVHHAGRNGVRTAEKAEINPRETGCEH